MSLIDKMFKDYTIQDMIKCHNDGNLVKFCKRCGSESFRENPTDSIDWQVVEKEIICNDCNYIVNYWSYGHYQNYDYVDEEYLEMEKRRMREKKIERIIK